MCFQTVVTSIRQRLPGTTAWDHSLWAGPLFANRPTKQVGGCNGLNHFELNPIGIIVPLLLLDNPNYWCKTALRSSRPARLHLMESPQGRPLDRLGARGPRAHTTQQAVSSNTETHTWGRADTEACCTHLPQDTPTQPLSLNSLSQASHGPVHARPDSRPSSRPSLSLHALSDAGAMQSHPSRAPPKEESTRTATK